MEIHIIFIYKEWIQFKAIKLQLLWGVEPGCHLCGWPWESAPHQETCRQWRQQEQADGLQQAGGERTGFRHRWPARRAPPRWGQHQGWTGGAWRRWTCSSRSCWRRPRRCMTPSGAPSRRVSSCWALVRGRRRKVALAPPEWRISWLACWYGGESFGRRWWEELREEMRGVLEII